MLKNKTIAVVVPAHNEEKQIGMVIETIPDFVDKIIVVNDSSKDKTAEIVKSFWQTKHNEGISIKNTLDEAIAGRFERANRSLQERMRQEIKFFVPSEVANSNPESERIILINLLHNGGVGAAIARGYKWCKDYGIDCTAVMAGDGQMDPAELESICNPIISENIDYVKGNRLIHRSALLVIPKSRYFGNSVLSVLTKLASGYWHVSDTQTGFTAISKKALSSIRLHEIYKRYGMPNDLLVKLNIAMCTLKEVEIKPVYDVGESSQMKIYKVIPKILLLLIKSFFKRLWIKYLFRDFHPLFLLYNFAFILGIVWIPYLYHVIKSLLFGLNMSFETLFAFSFLGITIFQSLLFAMLMDIQDNERLQKN
ncbi:MAG: glycosyltransferase family 2 protein [Bacteroidales bacterium]|nr:glycosyltransferase family 2 protein [Bacteroidales bacterium]